MKKTPEISSTVDRLIAQAEAQEKREEMTKEQAEQLRACINRIFSSEDGTYFWKFLRRGLKVDVIDKDYNPLTLAGDKAMRNIYLSIRAFFDADVKQKLEG